MALPDVVRVCSAFAIAEEGPANARMRRREPTGPRLMSASATRSSELIEYWNVGVIALAAAQSSGFPGCMTVARKSGR